MSLALIGPDEAEINVRLRASISSVDFNFLRACALADAGVAALTSLGLPLRPAGD